MTVFYAHLSTGLRGCYADNNGGPIKFSTRRELKKHVEYEADSMKEAGYTGASKRNVAAFVQEYWTRIHGQSAGYLSTVLPMTPHGTGHASWGVFLSPMSRNEFRESVKALEAGEW